MDNKTDYHVRLDVRNKNELKERNPAFKMFWLQRRMVLGKLLVSQSKQNISM